jgi:OmpA-OmpF porin, OOP family
VRGKRSHQDAKFYHVKNSIRTDLWSNLFAFALLFYCDHNSINKSARAAFTLGKIHMFSGLHARAIGGAHAAAAVLLGLSVTGLFAQSVKDAYVQDQRGLIVRDANFGDAKIGNLCWRTGYWTPALAIAECDPDIAPRPAPAPASKPAAAPVPFATAPYAPPPILAPAAPRKCDFTETLEADATFEFNKSQLRPGARAKLDRVATRAAGCLASPFVKITGHTDRLGSVAYNQKLSEARAAAVATYLKSKQVPVAQTAGAGKNEPVKACDPTLARPALIECLAPNRRVVVEVQGRAK